MFKKCRFNENFPFTRAVTMVLKQLIFVLTFLHFSYAQQEILRQCFPLPIVGSLCIRVTSSDCFELTGTISINDIAIFGPRTIPIGDVLSQVQSKLDDPNLPNKQICQQFDFGSGSTCNLCGTVDELRLNGDNLHYCGSAVLNCSLPIGQSVQNVSLPCVDIQNCKIFGCGNNCNNAGVCTSVGICRCNKGHYGLDCSTSIENNCIKSTSFNTSCWNTYFEDCRTINIDVTSSAGSIHGKYNLDEINMVDLSCQQIIKESAMTCDMCVKITDLQVKEKELIGCPNLGIKCNKMDVVSNRKIDCITIAKSDKLICPQPSVESPPTPKNDTGGSIGSASRVVLVVLATILGALLFTGAGYYIVTKWIGLYLPNPFEQSSPVVYVEDETPLNNVDEESSM